MLIQKAFKTKLRVNNSEASYFYACAGLNRFVYNWALADRIDRYKDGKSTNKFEQKKRFNALKHLEYPWIKEYPYIIVERAFDDLDSAYKNFFRRVKSGGDKPGFPKFKSRYRSTPKFCLGKSGVSVEPGRVRLPRIGWVRIEERDYFPLGGKLNSVTLSEKNGVWYISAQKEFDVEIQTAQNSPIGVDLGIKSLAVCSDGASFDNPKTLRKYERKMNQLQRELHRRKKGSSNREKTKAKIAKLHEKIANIRAATLHDISRYVTANAQPAIVVVEDLNVKGMMSNRKLSKAVADASMGELRRQIEYKAQWYGSSVYVADRWFPSSKMCSNCGEVKSDLTLSDRVYRCDCCGFEIDRDLNAALNLKNLVINV